MPLSHKFILATDYNQFLKLLLRGAVCVGQRAEEAMIWKIAETKAGAAASAGCTLESVAF